MKVAHNLDRHKISRAQPRVRFGRNSLPKLADFSLFCTEREVKMFRTYREIQNLDQNFSLKSWKCRKTSPCLKALGWPLISDEFEFRQDHTNHFGVTCTWVPKKSIFNFIRSIACVIFIQSSWNLQIYKTGMEGIFNKLKTRPHCSIYFGVACPWLLACWVSGERSLPIGLLVLVDLRHGKKLIGHKLCGFI